LDDIFWTAANHANDLGTARFNAAVESSVGHDAIIRDEPLVEHPRGFHKSIF
jgi:hypothetical protein